MPPSEGKSPHNTTDIPFIDTNYVYLEQVKQIIKMLNNLKEQDFKKIYCKDIEKAKAIHSKNINVINNKCSPAILRYTGTVYSNIGFDSFSEDEKEFFNQTFFIFSGLLGMVKPLTLIPNYKLKMNVLQLYKFWNPILSKRLYKEDKVFDLLPQIHKKAFNSIDHSINIDFVIYKNRKKVPAGHFGKVVKGKFIQYICKN